MRVLLAEHAGFCSGVKRALELTLREVDRGKKVSTLGPLVHNDEVINFLASKGVKVVDDPQELESGTVIIRTHGVPPWHLKLLREREHLEIIDATCPYVRSLQYDLQSNCFTSGFSCKIGINGRPDACSGR